MHFSSIKLESYSTDEHALDLDNVFELKNIKSNFTISYSLETLKTCSLSYSNTSISDNVNYNNTNINNLVSSDLFYFI